MAPVPWVRMWLILIMSGFFGSFRKFAEIEAANRQLSSAIFSREGEGTQASSPICVSSDQSEDVPGEGILS